MAEQGYPRKALMAFSLLLVVTAASLYWAWGVIYGSWNIFSAENMGIYSLFIVLLGMGVLGLLLVKYRR